MRLFLLSIDGLQPAYLGAYGNEWVETPNIDRWAAAGVVFDSHFADVPDSFTSLRSWRSGRHAARTTESDPDLIDALRSAGIPTISVASASMRQLRPALDKLENAERALLWLRFESLLPPWNIAAEAWEPFSLREPEDDDAEDLIHVEPWTSTLPAVVDADDDPLINRIQSTYAAAVSQLDASLGPLLEAVAKRGWTDIGWLLTSGRGLPLGEHGDAGFPGLLHEELVHLPLIIVWPDNRFAGSRVAGLTQTMDLAPTITDFFGIAWPHGDSLTSGRSVVPLGQSPRASHRTHAITAAGASYSVRTCEWYWQHSPPQQGRLFVKPDDRWEVNDVHQQHVEAAEELERVYREQFNRGAK